MPFSGKTEIFILSFDVNSNYNWSQKISSILDDNGYGITHDADSLYITGGINNSANFPGYINNPVTVSSKGCNNPAGWCKRYNGYRN